MRTSTCDAPCLPCACVGLVCNWMPPSRGEPFTREFWLARVILRGLKGVDVGSIFDVFFVNTRVYLFIAQFRQ